MKELSVAACDNEISNIPTNLQLEVLRGCDVSGALMASLIIAAKERIEEDLIRLIIKKYYIQRNKAKLENRSRAKSKSRLI